MPGLQARSPVQGMQEATTHWCFSPSLSPSLPLSKINKWNLLKKSFSPDQVAQLVGALPRAPRGCRFDPQSGYIQKANNWCFSLRSMFLSLCLSLSLSLSLSIPPSIKSIETCSWVRIKIFFKDYLFFKTLWILLRNFTMSRPPTLNYCIITHTQFSSHPHIERPPNLIDIPTSLSGAIKTPWIVTLPYSGVW